MQLFFWNASYISSSLLAMLLPFLVITMIFQLLIIVNYILFGTFKQLLFDNLWQISNRKRNVHSEQSLFIKLYSFFTRYKGCFFLLSETATLLLLHMFLYPFFLQSVTDSYSKVKWLPDIFQTIRSSIEHLRWYLYTSVHHIIIFHIS